MTVDKSTIINLTNVGNNWTMNMLKKSIAYMKRINTRGQYDVAIIKEENILRSFYDVALGRSQPEAA